MNPSLQYHNINQSTGFKMNAAIFRHQLQSCNSESKIWLCGKQHKQFPNDNVSNDEKYDT